MYDKAVSEVRAAPPVKRPTSPGQKVLAPLHAVSFEVRVVILPATAVNAKPGKTSVHIAATAAATGPLVFWVEAAMVRVVTVPAVKPLAEYARFVIGVGRAVPIDTARIFPVPAGQSQV